jgi:hypothetical protein
MVLTNLLISTTFTISYGLSFAGITSTLVHAFLYFRKQIWVQARRSLHEQPDIHARLMSHYRQGLRRFFQPLHTYKTKLFFSELVPEWWYVIIFSE